MHTAARRILPALLLLLALLVSALPRALAAGLENRYGIQMLDFDEDQILSIGNQGAACTPCATPAPSWTGRSARGPACGRTGRSGRRQGTAAFPAIWTPAWTNSTAS